MVGDIDPQGGGKGSVTMLSPQYYKPNDRVYPDLGKPALGEAVRLKTIGKVPARP